MQESFDTPYGRKSWAVVKQGLDLIDKPPVVATALAAIHLDAGHDVNGNPRRAYMVVCPNRGIIDAINEGYRGRDALKDKYPGLEADDCRVPTTKKFIRDLLKSFS